MTKQNIKRRKKSRKKTGASSRSVWTVIIVVAIIVIVATANDHRKAVDYDFDGDNVAALLKVDIPDSVSSEIVGYLGYSLSFNPKYHIPNWVAWELTADETDGSNPRYNKFLNDPEVKGCAETYDYLYSGYDRGHMAPAADMKWSEEAMKQSFYLTNICPQANELNTGAWRTLEEKCRQWAKADSSIIIIAGPILNPPPYEFIGDNRVAVPRKFFKIVLAPYAKPMRAIAFVMPNSKVKGGMQAAATSVDYVEELTGYDFFSALPDSIEKIVESQNDFPYWSTVKPGRK